MGEFFTCAGNFLPALLYAVPAFAALLLIAVHIFLSVRNAVQRSRYRVRRRRKRLLAVPVSYLCRYSLPRKILVETAVRMGMLTGYSFQTNLETAFIVVLLLSVCAFLYVLTIMPGTGAAWYLIAANLAASCLYISMALYLLGAAARVRFTSKLPKAFKLINTRYISLGSIVKALYACMDDFDTPVRKVMMQIYTVLKKNNMSEIDNTFDLITKTYKSEYLTLLINLIRQAYYKGGEAAIKQQFEQSAEDVLEDIENTQDLAAAGGMYLIAAAFTPLAIKGIELFNRNALMGKAVEFYSGPDAMEIKLLFMAALVAYVMVILILQKTAV